MCLNLGDIDFASRFREAEEFVTRTSAVRKKFTTRDNLGGDSVYQELTRKTTQIGIFLKRHIFQRILESLSNYSI